MIFLYILLGLFAWTVFSVVYFISTSLYKRGGGLNKFESILCFPIYPLSWLLGVIYNKWG